MMDSVTQNKRNISMKMKPNLLTIFDQIGWITGYDQFTIANEKHLFCGDINIFETWTATPSVAYQRCQTWLRFNTRQVLI